MRSAPTLFQDLVEIETRGLKRRCEPEDHTGRQRDHGCEQQNAAVHRDFVQPRQAGRRDCHEAANTPGGDEHAHDTGNNGQQRALGHQLTHDAAARRADCRTDCQLARTRGPAREQQVADVDAGDQQHDHHDAEDQVQRRADVSHQLLEEHVDGNALRVVRLWIRRFEPARDGVQLALRLREADAWLEPADRAVVVRRARGRLRDHPPRRPDVGADRKPEFRCQHAHHGIRAVRPRDAASERAPVTAEMRHPEGVADDDGQWAAGALLGGVRQTPQPGARGHQREELGRGARDDRVVGGAVDGHAGLHAIVRGEAVEHGGLVVPVVEIRG
jgi:hypothetical protein